MTTVPLTSLMVNWSAANQPKSRMSVAGLKSILELVPQFQTILIAATGRLRARLQVRATVVAPELDLSVPVSQLASVLPTLLLYPYDPNTSYTVSVIMDGFVD